MGNTPTVSAVRGKIVHVDTYTVRVERLLGEGGFAYVFLVADLSDESTTPTPITARRVLKRMRIAADNEDAVKLAKRELELMRQLPAHRNLIRFLACDTHEENTRDVHYTDFDILMEYASGGSVADEVAAFSTRHERIPERRVLRRWRDLLSSLSHLHSLAIPHFVVHRDIKLENLLLVPVREDLSNVSAASITGVADADGSLFIGRLADFGSCVIGSIPLENASQVVAEEDVIDKTTTLAYRSPELLDLHSMTAYRTSEERALGPASDIWAAGVALYKMCFGGVGPFDDPSTGAPQRLSIANGKFTIPRDSPYSAGVHSLITNCLVVDSRTRMTATQLLALGPQVCPNTWPPVPTADTRSEESGASVASQRLTSHSGGNSANSNSNSSVPHWLGGRKAAASRSLLNEDDVDSSAFTQTLRSDVVGVSPQKAATASFPPISRQLNAPPPPIPLHSRRRSSNEPLAPSVPLQGSGLQQQQRQSERHTRSASASSVPLFPQSSIAAPPLPPPRVESKLALRGQDKASHSKSLSQPVQTTTQNTTSDNLSGTVWDFVSAVPNDANTTNDTHFWSQDDENLMIASASPAPLAGSHPPAVTAPVPTRTILARTSDTSSSGNSSSSSSSSNSNTSSTGNSFSNAAAAAAAAASSAASAIGAAFSGAAGAAAASFSGPGGTSALREQIQTRMLQLLGPEQRRERNVIKATSRRPGAPKAKYVRRLILDAWEERSADSGGGGGGATVLYLPRRPVTDFPIVAVKAAALTLRLLQQGPPSAVGAVSNKLQPTFQQMERAWSTAAMTAVVRAAELQSTHEANAQVVRGRAKSLPLLQSPLFLRYVAAFSGFVAAKLAFFASPGITGAVSAHYDADLALAAAPSPACCAVPLLARMTSAPVHSAFGVATALVTLLQHIVTVLTAVAAVEGLDAAVVVATARLSATLSGKGSSDLGHNPNNLSAMQRGERGLLSRSTNRTQTRSSTVPPTVATAVGSLPCLLVESWDLYCACVCSVLLLRARGTSNGSDMGRHITPQEHATNVDVLVNNIHACIPSLTTFYATVSRLYAHPQLQVQLDVHEAVPTRMEETALLRRPFEHSDKQDGPSAVVAFLVAARTCYAPLVLSTVLATAIPIDAEPPPPSIVSPTYPSTSNTSSSMLPTSSTNVTSLPPQEILRRYVCDSGPVPNVTAGLAAIRAAPGNDICAECGDARPVWASVNLGMLFCLRCSGIHRSLGVHISAVRSMTLDTWKPIWVQTVLSIGNTRGNAYWEANVSNMNSHAPAKPTPASRMADVSEWCRAKYERRMFAAEGHPPHELLLALRTLVPLPPTTSTIVSTHANSSERAPEAVGRVSGSNMMPTTPANRDVVLDAFAATTLFDAWATPTPHSPLQRHSSRGGAAPPSGGEVHHDEEENVEGEEEHANGDTEEEKDEDDEDASSVSSQ